MYKDYPKLIRLSQNAYNLLAKASKKNGVSMAKLLSDYVLKNNDHGNYFLNWLRDYSTEKTANSLKIVKEEKNVSKLNKKR